MVNDLSELNEMNRLLITRYQEYEDREAEVDDEEKSRSSRERRRSHTYNRERCSKIWHGASVEGWTLVSVNDIGCAKSTKVLKNASGSLGGACSLSGE